MEHTSPTSRRTLVRAAAWSVPAVGAVSVAPAFAATTPFVPESGAFLMAAGTVSGASRDTFTVLSSGIADPVTLTVTTEELRSSAALGPYEGANRNFDVVPIDPPEAAAPHNGLLLQFHHTGSFTFAARFRLQFSRPVTDLSFRVAGVSFRLIQEALEVSSALSVSSVGSAVDASHNGEWTTVLARGTVTPGLPTDPACQATMTGGGTYTSLLVDAWRAGGSGAAESSTYEAYLGDISFTTTAG